MHIINDSGDDLVIQVDGGASRVLLRPDERVRMGVDIGQLVRVFTGPAKATEGTVRPLGGIARRRRVTTRHFWRPIDDRIKGFLMKFPESTGRQIRAAFGLNHRDLSPALDRLERKGEIEGRNGPHSAVLWSVI